MPESPGQDVGPSTLPSARVELSPERWSRWTERICHEAVDAERTRVADELNSVVVRRLFALGLSLESAVGLHPELADSLRPLIRETDELIRAVRDVAFGARPGADGSRAAS